MKYFKNKYSEVELTKKNNWADIYSAINNETNEKVQLRILKNQSNNTNYINLITYKINELQGLKHENLIGINGINSFIENERVYYYIETEYFNGKSLSDRMILKSHTCKESLEIIKQVAKGLNEFHYRGLNYETLSSENIFINAQGVVKIDVLSYISQKYDEDEEYEDYEEVEEEIDNDIYAIGAILYQLITRDSDFKLKKLKKNIDDDEVYSMLYALTSKKKKYKYENLNTFLSDVNEHLQYLSSDYEQDVDGYKIDEEYEDDYEYKKSLIIKRFCACLAVVLVLSGGIKVMGLVKSNKDKDETTIEMAIEKESSDKEVEKQEPEKEQVKQPEDNKIESTDNTTTNTDNTTTNNVIKDNDSTNKENTTTNNSTTQKPSGSNSTNIKPSGGSNSGSGTGGTSGGSNSGNKNPGTSGGTSSGNKNPGTSGGTSSGNKNPGTSGGSDSGSGNSGTSGGSDSGSGNSGTSGENSSGSETGETSGGSNSESGTGGTSEGSNSGSGTGGTSGGTSSEGGNTEPSVGSDSGSEVQVQVQVDPQDLQEPENME